MTKTIFIASMILLLSISFVFAHEHDFAETKKLIDSKISCDKLVDEQLESIGEYYMGQVHPGEAHELMDKMMGGEGSETLRQMHINMAKRLYCNENINIGMMGGGMMSMMMGMQNPMQTNLAQGMMGNFGYDLGYWIFLNALYAILLIGLIILVFLGIVKLWKDLFQKKSNRQ